MPLDGIALRAITRELNDLVGAKINKISQPKKLDLVISLYKKTSLKLYLTANASSPRVNLTDETFENPMVPPNFCMVLRKHIQGGTILGVDQFKLDRVIKINISTYDEMGYLVTKSLVIEIMGKHSNIILIDESNKIIDSLTKVNSLMSRVRELMPGLIYRPLEDNKIDLLKQDTLPSQVIDRTSNSQTYKAFYQNFTGMSPALGKELSFQADIDPLFPQAKLEEEDIKRIDIAYLGLREKIRSNNFSPTIIYAEDKKSLKDFYCFDLSYLSGPRQAYQSLNQVLDTYYKSIKKADKLKDKLTNLTKLVEDKIGHLASKIEEKNLGILKAQEREIYKIYADILSANFHILKGGEKEISLNNFYDEDLKPIVIPLDITKTGPQNAQAYYKKYSKLKNREHIFKKDLPALEDELAYLKQVQGSLAHIENLEDLDEIREELSKAGYIRRKQVKNKKNLNKNQKRETKPLKFTSSDGHLIYVGKNNTQNDYITLKLAGKDDYFFHVQTHPGSHVIVKDDKEISDTTILEAAFLAANYSSVSDEPSVTVDYTKKKNVYKAKGAKPGMVYYNDFSSINVDTKNEDLKKILENKN